MVCRCSITVLCLQVTETIQGRETEQKVKLDHKCNLKNSRAGNKKNVLRYLSFLKDVDMFHTIYYNMPLPPLSSHHTPGTAATQSAAMPFRQKSPLWALWLQPPNVGTSQALNESFPIDERQKVSSDGWTEQDQSDISLTSKSSSISQIKLVLKLL